MRSPFYFMIAAIFDTETTGLPLHPSSKPELQPRMIEFGGVLIDHEGVEHGELSLIVDPEMTIEPIITKITGLTNDDLRGQPKFQEVYPQIKDFFAKADVVIAHNLPFDTTIIDLEIGRLSSELQSEFVWPKIKFCTVQENIPFWGRRAKLIELYERTMGKPLAQTHRALDDCRALAEIVLKEDYLNAIISATKN